MNRRESLFCCESRAVIRYVYIWHLIMGLTATFTEPATLSVSSSSVTDYLQQFGYLTPQDPKTGALRSEEYVVGAIKRFQKMAGIPQTGQVDEETQKMLNMPRCGNSDNIELGRGARRKRYALQGSKWAKVDLTYRISAYPLNIPRQQVDNEILKALQVWAEVTPLSFSKKDYGTVDVDVKFVRRSHGDGNPFDGRGRTLAHAFFPQYGGDAHFDDDEEWTVDLSLGVNLFQVAAHEFGHSLGLSHSDVNSALMAPFYRGFQRYFKLDDDDVSAIQELYGERNTFKAVTPFVPRPNFRSTGPPVNIPDICSDPSIDAIVMNADRRTYIFKGDKYFLLNDFGIDQDYPRNIADDWAGLQGPIDSALHWDNGYTFLFKGQNYWKFYNQNFIYVRKISDGFKGIPDNIDASFVWGGNGKTYFFKGDQYWRYTENNADRGYPQPLSVWSGLPSRIDAAIKWRNGRTYFFSGTQYYRYNDVEFNIDATYPRKIGNWWLGCPEDTKIREQDQRRIVGSNKSSSQVDVRGSDVNSGIHGVAKDDVGDQFISVDNSQTDDSPKNGSPSHRQQALASFSILLLCRILS